MQQDAGVLPDAGVVIFDEAHELEDVAADYFGVTVSNLRVDELLRDVENTLAPGRHSGRRCAAGFGARARAFAIFLLDSFRRAKAALPSRIALNFWKKMAMSISACRTR